MHIIHNKVSFKKDLGLKIVWNLTQRLFHVDLNRIGYYYYVRYDNKIAILRITFFGSESVLLLQMASANDARYGQKESTDQNFDYMFKILIIGNSSVGKTSFLFRYADDSFTPAFVSTVGIDFKVKTIYRNDKRIKLQIWVRSLSKASFNFSFCLSLKFWFEMHIIDFG